MASLHNLLTEDPALTFVRMRARFHTARIRRMYPFRYFGRGVSIDFRCEIRRSSAHRIIIGDKVFLNPHVWLNVVTWDKDPPSDPAIILGPGCALGRRTILAAKNCIELEEGVLAAPSVYITDHAHEYSDVSQPIIKQGLSQGGHVRIERGCWLGVNSVIYCGSGELVLGRNCIVGANTFVNKSFPPYSILAGNPARVIRRYDPELKTWIKADSTLQPEFK